MLNKKTKIEKELEKRLMQFEYEILDETTKLHIIDVICTYIKELKEKQKYTVKVEIK